MKLLDFSSLERLRAGLAPPIDPEEPLHGPHADRPPRRGAVLALIYPHRGEFHLALQRRPAELPEHAGQISLPGGGRRPSDRSFLHTAQRETLEELGVPPQLYDVWGRLQLVTIMVSNYLVVPFVGVANVRPLFLPSVREVHELLEVPLSSLMDPTALESEIWEVRGQRRRVVFYRCGELKIWGATARVLGQITSGLAGSPPSAGVLIPGAVDPFP